jgi:hypothetical protein
VRNGGRKHCQSPLHIGDSRVGRKRTDLDGKGLVLALLEELGETGTTVEEETGRGVEVGTELGEGGDITVLSEVKLEGTGNGLHDLCNRKKQGQYQEEGEESGRTNLGLGGRSDTGDGKTDVNRGTDTLEEELSLQEDLTVTVRERNRVSIDGRKEREKRDGRDGNDVGRNVSRDITTLGLDNGKGSEGSTSVLVGELGGTLEETGVEVEDVSGVSLTSGRATEEEGHLTVGDGLLRQVIVDDEGVLSVVTEPLSDGGTGEGSEVLEGGGLGGGGGDDDGVLEGVVLLEGLDELGDSRTLLANGDVDAVKLLNLVVTVVPLLLVEDRVDGDSGLTGLTVTDDQLTLTTTDGNHGVDRLETSKHGLADGSTGKDTGGLDLSTAALSSLDGALSVDGVSESVDDTAEHGGADGDVDDGTGTLDSVTLLAIDGVEAKGQFRVGRGMWEEGRFDEHLTIVTEDGNTDVVYRNGRTS